jgi:hypothetical protein
LVSVSSPELEIAVEVDAGNLSGDHIDPSPSRRFLKAGNTRAGDRFSWSSGGSGIS